MKMILAPEGIYLDGVESLPEVDDIRIRMPSGEEYEIVQVIATLERFKGVTPVAGHKEAS